jgi:hypothetical protein
MDSIDKGNGISPGRRYRVTSSGEARVYERPSSSSKSLHRLQAGQVVVVAEVHVDEAGGSFARLNSPAGWLEMGRLAPAPPIPSVRLDRPTFMERHREEAPGDHSGLTFPVTLEALWKAGPEFLTRAFRSSGRLDDDNAVTEIVSLDRHVLKGASDNALLTVRYAKPDPGLHTDLFVKLPPDDVERKFHVAGMAYGEILIARRSSEGILPVPVADCISRTIARARRTTCSSPSASLLVRVGSSRPGRRGGIRRCPKSRRITGSWRNRSPDWSRRTKPARWATTWKRISPFLERSGTFRRYRMPPKRSIG